LPNPSLGESLMMLLCCALTGHDHSLTQDTVPTADNNARNNLPKSTNGAVQSKWVAMAKLMASAAEDIGTVFGACV